MDHIELNITDRCWECMDWIILARIGPVSGFCIKNKYAGSIKGGGFEFLNKY
jgi:hypothetical protein